MSATKLMRANVKTILCYGDSNGGYQNAIALDRVIMTLIGGGIVIISTPISYIFVNSALRFNNKLHSNTK